MPTAKRNLEAQLCDICDTIQNCDHLVTDGMLSANTEGFFNCCTKLIFLPSKNECVCCRKDATPYFTVFLLLLEADMLRTAFV